MADNPDFIRIEGKRIQAEYARRQLQVDGDRYAPWKPATHFMLDQRRRVAAQLLHQLGKFPQPGHRCLEIGFGSLGWLGELVTWGVEQSNLHGIELSVDRVEKARKLMPSADLRVGDASQLPWTGSEFNLVIASTVFSSILDSRVRRAVAAQILRVLLPGGALLWYDFRVNNSGNPHVRRVDKRELRQLFPGLGGLVRSVTLVPPMARWLAPKSWVLASLLEAVPCLRTHLLAVLIRE